MPCTRAQEIDVAAFAVDPRAEEWAAFRDHHPRCTDCSREVARFAALTSALAAGGTSAHPSEAELLALATSAKLAQGERVRLEAHLAGCAPCRTELAVARGFDFAGIAERRRPTTGRGLRFRRPALAAAAIVALAVPAAILASRFAREASPAPSLPTAQTERSAPLARVEPPPPEPRPGEGPARGDPPVAPAPVAPPGPSPLANPPAGAIPSAESEVVEAPAAQPPRPIQIAALVPSDSPHYVSGRLANEPSVRIGGAARGSGASAPAPEALGPEHVGVSAKESPSLYWFLPAETSLPVEVTVVDPDAVTPLLAITSSGPLEAGVHRVSLAEHGARLRPGVEYRWFVALVRDPEERSEDVVSGAGIRYAPPDSELDARFAAAPPGHAAHLYAQSGLWYDAFDQVSSWLAAEPAAALLRAHRAALLDQVGLGDAAAFERHLAPAQR